MFARVAALCLLPFARGFLDLIRALQDIESALNDVVSQRPAALSPNITDLDNDTFDSFVNTSSAVLYFVPWCHYCNMFMPIFKAWAEMADRNHIGPNGPIKFGRVNLEDKKNAAIGRKMNVRSYPTLYLHLPNTAPIKYEDDIQSYADLFRFLTSNTKGSILIRSNEDLEELLDLLQNDLAIFGVNLKDPSSQEAFRAVEASQRSELAFFQVETEDLSPLIARVAPSLHPSVQYLRDHKDASFLLLNNPFLVDRFPTLSDGSDTDANVLLSDATEKAHGLRTGDLRKSEVIQRFIEEMMFPVLSRFDSRLGKVIMSSSSKSLLVCFTNASEWSGLNSALDLPGRSVVEDTLYKASLQLRGRVVSFVSGLSTFAERRLIQFLGLEPGNALVLLNMEDRPGVVKYVAPPEVRDNLFAPMTQARSKAEDGKRVGSKTLEGAERDQHISAVSARIVKWANSALIGKLNPTIRSEPPLPEENNVGVVRVLTAETMRRELEVLANHTVVDFYAPWCGHCRVLFPIFERVAKAFKQAGVQHVRFAKLDAAANETPGLSLSGFPTIAIFSRGSRVPRLHAGAFHSAEELIRFISSHVKLEKDKVLTALHNPGDDDELPKLADEL